MARSNTTAMGAASPRFAQNLIINGNMDIWQRGLSFSSVNTTFSVDRFFYAADAGPVDIARAADSPNNATTYSMAIGRVSTLAVGASQVAYVKQVIEGTNLARIRGKKFTLSFWVKSTTAGLYTVQLSNFDRTRNYTVPYTITTSNTWQYIKMTVQHDETGAWNYGESSGLQVFFILAAGTTFANAPANTWNTSANLWAVTGQTNLYGAANSNFRLTQVMLNEGDFAAPFSLATPTRQAEFALCQRYFERSYNEADGLGTNTNNEAFLNSASTGNFTCHYKVTKRITPTILLYSPGFATVGVWDNTGGNQYVVVAQAIGTNAFVVATGNFPGNSAIRGHWTADAELS